MSQFEAKVKATLDLSGVNSDLQKIANKPIVLKNVKIGNIDMSALQAQANRAGQVVGRGMAQGTKQAMASLSGLDKALNTQKFAADVSTLRAQFEKVANSGHKLVDGFQENNSVIQKNIDSLEQMAAELEVMRDVAEPKELAAKFKEYNTVLATTKNQIKTVTGEMKQFASATQIASTQNKMTAFLQSGTKAAQKYKTEVKALIDEINRLNASGNGRISASDMSRINDQFKTYEQAARINGQNSLTFGTKLKNTFSKLTNYVGASTMIYGSIRTIKNGINEVVELDNALVDLKKTSNATKQELDDFYYSANDSAKKLGTSTQDIIQAAAD